MSAPYLLLALTVRDRIIAKHDGLIRSIAPPATEAEKLAVKRQIRYLEEFSPRGKVKAVAEKFLDEKLEPDPEAIERYAIRHRVSPDSFRVILRRVRNGRRAAA